MGRFGGSTGARSCTRPRKIEHAVVHLMRTHPYNKRPPAARCKPMAPPSPEPSSSFTAHGGRLGWRAITWRRPPARAAAVRSE